MSISAAQQFVDRWERATVNEKGAAQSHFTELCWLLGIPTPMEADPTGTRYRFEKPLSKAGGGAGFADVWRDEMFVWEYKSRGKSLDLARQQILNYKGDLGNPPVMVLCDFARYELYVEFTGFRTRVETFTNHDLLDARTRDLLRVALTDPQQLRPAEKTLTITEKVAAQFADVARLIEQRGHDPHEVAHFFIQSCVAG